MSETRIFLKPLPDVFQQDWRGMAAMRRLDAVLATDANRIIGELYDALDAPLNAKIPSFEVREQARAALAKVSSGTPQDDQSRADSRGGNEP